MSQHRERADNLHTHSKLGELGGQSATSHRHGGCGRFARGPAGGRGQCGTQGRFRGGGGGGRPVDVRPEQEEEEEEEEGQDRGGRRGGRGRRRRQGGGGGEVQLRDVAREDPEPAPRQQPGAGRTQPHHAQAATAHAHGNTEDLVGELPGHLPADEEAAGARLLLRSGGTGNGRFHRRKPALGLAREVRAEVHRVAPAEIHRGVRDVPDVPQPQHNPHQGSRVATLLRALPGLWVEPFCRTHPLRIPRANARGQACAAECGQVKEGFVWICFGRGGGGGPQSRKVKKCMRPLAPPSFCVLLGRSRMTSVFLAKRGGHGQDSGVVRSFLSSG